MKIHFITIGKPKLAYAKQGWDEYMSRLQRLHQVHITQLADRYAYDARKILDTSAGSTRIVLEIEGLQLSSEQIAAFLIARELEGKEASFIIGGPEGLPQQVRDQADYQWSLGRHTLPHDLAMVVTLEALYRASTINAHLPYHK
jgi:23S rRNA (pseudouridine1915-N3)-methyltransferase